MPVECRIILEENHTGIETYADQKSEYILDQCVSCKAEREFGDNVAQIDHLTFTADLLKGI